MEEDYKEALTEVFDVINNSEQDIKNKIPNKLFEFLKNNVKKEYIVNIDYRDNNWDKKIKQDAKEILALIYRDYLVTPEEREQLLKEEAEEERKIEQELREKYNPYNIFKKNKQYEKQEELSLVVKEENVWYKKFISKIISLFKRKFK